MVVPVLLRSHVDDGSVVSNFMERSPVSPRSSTQYSVITMVASCWHGYYNEKGLLRAQKAKRNHDMSQTPHSSARHEAVELFNALCSASSRRAGRQRGEKRQLSALRGARPGCARARARAVLGCDMRSASDHDDSRPAASP